MVVTGEFDKDRGCYFVGYLWLCDELDQINDFTALFMLYY